MCRIRRMHWMILMLVLLCPRKSATKEFGDQESCRSPLVAEGEEDVLVSVSVSEEEAGGLQSIWGAVQGHVDRIHLYVAAGVSIPQLPSGFGGCIEVFKEGAHEVGAASDGSWKGFQIVMEDTIEYPIGYIEVATSVVEAYSRDVIVAYDGAVWNELDLKNPVLVSTGGVREAVMLDTWVDVLRLGTVVFHAHALRGKSPEEDWRVGRFLPVLTGLEDVRWAAAVHHAGVARLVAYHEQGWLQEISRKDGELGRGKGVLVRAVKSGVGGDDGLRMAGHFAPWTTMFDNRVPNTQMADIQRQSGQSDSRLSYTIAWLEVPQAEYKGGAKQDASDEDGDGDSAQTAGEAGNVSIVIPVFWRPRIAFLRETVRGLVKMNVVDRVIIINNNPDWRGVTFDRRAYQGKVWVVQGEGGGAGLNARFFPRKLVRTDCVMSMDDDFRPVEQQVKDLVRVWQAFPDRLVGPMWLVTRHTECYPGAGTKKPCLGHVYGMGGWKGFYNMILTGMAVWHRGYMPLYWAAGGAMDDVRAHVQQAVNCEDIAMNFLVASVQQQAPIAVDVGDVLENEVAGGLSGRGAGHYAQRTECINSFVSFFGDMPLVNCTLGSPYRNSYHAFASYQDAQAEAADSQEEGTDVLQCAWRAWEEAGGGDCGVRKLGVLPSAVIT